MYSICTKNFFYPVQYENLNVDCKTFNIWRDPELALEITNKRHYYFNLLFLNILLYVILYINFKYNYYDIFMHKQG